MLGGRVWLVYFSMLFSIPPTQPGETCIHYCIASAGKEGRGRRDRALAFFFVFVTRQGKLHSLLVGERRGLKSRILCGIGYTWLGYKLTT